MTTRTTQETLSAAEAKSRFAEALRRAEGGDVVVITRYGKPVAALVSADDLAGVRRLRASSPKDGLAGLVGRWDDGAELADEVDRVVAERVHSPARTIQDLD
jgi:prevent-host-death family protein